MFQLAYTVLILGEEVAFTNLTRVLRKLIS